MKRFLTRKNQALLFTLGWVFVSFGFGLIVVGITFPIPLIMGIIGFILILLCMPPEKPETPKKKIPENPSER